MLALRRQAGSTLCRPIQSHCVHQAADYTTPAWTQNSGNLQTAGTAPLPRLLQESLLTVFHWKATRSQGHSKTAASGESGTVAKRGTLDVAMGLEFRVLILAKAPPRLLPGRWHRKFSHQLQAPFKGSDALQVPANYSRPARDPPRSL